MIGFNSGGSTVLFEDGLGVASGSFAGSITTAGADRIGFVAYTVYKPFASVPIGIAFEWGSGNSMTYILEVFMSNDVYLGLHYILNPPTGSNSPSWTGGGGIMCAGAFSAFEVDQVTPFSGVDSATAQDHLDIASLAGELALAIAGIYSGTPITVSSPATQIGTIQQAFFPINTTAGYDAGANPSTTITFSSVQEALIGISLKPVSAPPASGFGQLLSNKRNRLVQ